MEVQMSAELFDPAAISMTPAAQAHVRRQLAKNSAEALKLGITQSGCNGYMYELAYLGGDLVGRAFEFDGVTVVVDDADWKLVQGTAIDYVTEGLNSALTFKNPNATAECGCGESFSVTTAEVP
jgi:iron-sulfur cluster assembly accessory protein